VDFAQYVFAGFVAQLIDGALGMAYGVTCSSLLLSFGLTPASASASVHLAEVVTSGISGHFHWRLGNVDRQLFRNLLWPGMIGGAVGAYLLVSLPAEPLRPWVAIYLALMGGRIVVKAWSGRPPARPSSHRLEFLGFTGGLLDAVGGGGWGPIVTSTLIGRGHEPRLAIGSVNRAEFFVTIVQSSVFAVSLHQLNWQAVAGLCLGGALAAPLGAHVASRVRAENLMMLVGLLILALSLRIFVLALW